MPAAYTLVLSLLNSRYCMAGDSCPPGGAMVYVAGLKKYSPGAGRWLGVILVAPTAPLIKQMGIRRLFTSSCITTWAGAPTNLKSGRQTAGRPQVSLSANGISAPNPLQYFIYGDTAGAFTFGPYSLFRKSRS